MLSPQAAGLACPNYAAGGSPRQQLAGLTTVALAADPFATEAEHLAVERPNDRLICVTVRLDMDHGPMLYRTTSVVAGENAAPNLFANLLLKQGGEPAEAHHLGINSSQLGSSLAARGRRNAQPLSMRGVKVISPHRPDDQHAMIYDNLLLALVWANCTGADQY